MIDINKIVDDYSSVREDVLSLVREKNLFEQKQIVAALFVYDTLLSPSIDKRYTSNPQNVTNLLIFLADLDPEACFLGLYNIFYAYETLQMELSRLCAFKQEPNHILASYMYEVLKNTNEDEGSNMVREFYKAANLSKKDLT